MKKEDSHKALWDNIPFWYQGKRYKTKYVKHIDHGDHGEVVMKAIPYPPISNNLKRFIDEKNALESA